MKKLFFAGLIAALFVACHKDFDNTTVTPLGPIPVLNVQSSLYGRVIDDSGNPLPNISVKVAGQTLTTNDQGLFFLYDKQLDQNGTYVQASAAGYYPASRFAHPHLGTSAYMEITMLEKHPISFLTNTDVVLAVNGDASVEIPKEGLVTADGQAYSGTFQLAAYWLDPSDAQTFDRMPGDLRAQDADGRGKVLKTYGMLGVDISTPSGAPLQLAPGKKANIRFPIPASMQANAPQSITLWHFDENSGYWLEEGTANRVGEQYQADVSHFSFWNCDIPADYIVLNGCLANLAGLPLSGTSITLTSPQFGTGYDYTDTDGFFGGLVPANEPLVLRVIGRCNDVLYESTIGPFSSNTTLNKINVAPNNQTEITIQGNLVDCNGLPLASGLVYVQDSALSVVLTADANGHFEKVFYLCYPLTNVSIIAYDANTPLQSAFTTVNVSGSVANVGTIPVCTAADQYITITVNGLTKTYYQQPNFAPNYIYASGAADSTGIQLYFNDYAAGTNQATITYLNGVYQINNLYQYYGCEYCTGCNCDPTDTGALIFTHYPQFVGDYATGSASGSVFLGTGLVPYTLNFRLKRTQ